MEPKFGTSGLRGLVTDLTPELVANYTKAFIASCPTGQAIHVGQDLRPSSPDIAKSVIEAIQQTGQTAIDCGILPTPALAYSSMQLGHAAVMVTGSHIPADRNGLKFYLPSGEISKSDETAILACLGADETSVQPHGKTLEKRDSLTPFLERYINGFGPEALVGLRIGVYQHSSVARDFLVETLNALGAEVIALARSEVFIPVDTEAVDPETRGMVAAWIKDHRLNALVSTDGDADRPMLAIAPGQIVQGDVLGALTAQFLGANVLCTPVSSNSMIEAMPQFSQIERTRIGSPYVIAAMEQVLEQSNDAKLVGYEANGGFLLGFTAEGPNGTLAPLMTRDCVLPILAPLALAKSQGRSLAEIIETLPQRVTFADRLQGIAPETSAAFLQGITQQPAERAAFFSDMPPEMDLNTTDGLRLTFENGDIVHLRPSGNAPEFRCYAESENQDRAEALVQRYLGKLAVRLA